MVAVAHISTQWRRISCVVIVFCCCDGVVIVFCPEEKPWPLLRRLRQHNDPSSEDCRVRIQSRLYCGPVASVPYVHTVGGVRSSHS
jgi:hypothetical protein